MAFPWIEAIIGRQPIAVWPFPDAKFWPPTFAARRARRTSRRSGVLQLARQALPKIRQSQITFRGATEMFNQKAGRAREWRIDVKDEYELCAWARHFNASQQSVREAVQAVGDRADKVGEHLARADKSPSGKHRGDRPN
jgi:hypothetical protein